LVPEANHAVLVEGYGSDTSTTLTAMTADGKLAVSYIPSTGTHGRELTVALSRFAKPVTARWYNPTNGRVVSVVGSPLLNRDTRRIRTPGDNGTRADDWVLVLDAR